MKFILFILSVSSVSPAVLNTEQNFNAFAAGRHLEYIASEKDLSIEELQKKTEWQVPDSALPSFGITEKKYYFRIKAENNTSEHRQFYMNIEYPPLDTVVFYKPLQNGKYRQISTGDTVNFSHRELMTPNYAFLLNVGPRTAKTYYLKIASSGPVNVPVYFYEIKEMTESIAGMQLVIGLFYGLSIIMALYSFFVYWGIRETGYLYYSLYIICSMGVFSIINGVGFQFLWPEWPQGNNLNPLFMPLTTFWVVMFTRSFLRTAQTLPRLDKVLKVLSIIMLLDIMVAFFLPHSTGIATGMLVSLISLVAISVTGIVSLMNKHKQARFFVSAWGALLTGAIVLALKNFALLPETPLTAWGYQIGSSFMVLLLSLGLADHVNRMKKEKENAQNLARKRLEDLNEAYGRFVPHSFLRLLGKNNILEVSLGDQIEKKMTILFSDIRSFSTISEKMSPQKNFNFLNSFLGYVSPIVKENNGIIDKYLGDGIMAIFAHSADDAIKAAIGIQNAVDEYNRNNHIEEPIIVGIGIHTGNLMLGTIGYHEYMQGTVIADAVNLASRLEGLTKEYSENILISEECRNELTLDEEYHFKRIGRVSVKGKSNETVVYSVSRNQTSITEPAIEKAYPEI